MTPDATASSDPTTASHIRPSTVLVTGGASGIGLALAARWLASGAEVIVCGPREEALAAARAQHPGLRTRVCDIADPAQRVALRDWVIAEAPGLDVLVNNAGIQRRMDLRDPGPWEATRGELAVNLEAPIHLATLFLPHLLSRPAAAIVNVSSGLAFVPLAAVPVYCATKAALHSFTLSLRHQLMGTAVRVVELMPPAVDTDLGGPGLHTFGVPLAEFADAVFPRLLAGETEIAYGFAAQSSQGSRAELEAIFQRMNAPRGG
jgi:uncharacterized oxidoreductase